MHAGLIKIAIVCSTLNRLGGPATHILNIYKYLNNNETSSTLIFCSAAEDDLREFMLSGGVHAEDMIFIPHAKKRLLVPFVLELRDIFRREKFDIVHAIETQTQVLAGVAARQAGIRGFICQCEAQFLPSTISFPKRVLFRILNLLLKNYFRLSVTVSRGLAKELVEKGFRPAAKVEVVHLGIAPAESFIYRGFEGRALVIGTLSRLSIEKGLDRFIRAAVLVAREFPLARFVIYGDGDEKKRLESLAHDLGIEGRIDFRPWTKDVRAALQGIDVYVMPSLREGLPISLLEAMSAGRPAVASDIEGIRDVIENGVDGILVDTADAEAFAKAIISVCRDPQKAAQMGRKGFEKVRACFTVEREMQRMREIYREILVGEKP